MENKTAKVKSTYGIPSYNGFSRDMGLEDWYVEGASLRIEEEETHLHRRLSS